MPLNDFRAMLKAGTGLVTGLVVHDARAMIGAGLGLLWGFETHGPEPRAPVLG